LPPSPKAGAEVDFVLDLGKRLVPIEVKWTDEPSAADARGPSEENRSSW